MFHLAVRKKSPKIILAHNHPSGYLKPSASDKAIAEQLVEGGRILAIEELDHLIISEASYYSFSQQQLL